MASEPTELYPKQERPMAPVHKKMAAFKSEYSNVKHPSAVKLIPAAKSEPSPDAPITGLTKEELAEYINSPFWKSVRKGLLGGTIALFVTFFVAAISIILFDSNCVISKEITRNSTYRSGE